MKILLLGGGGREHALAWKISQSQKTSKLYIAPGNAGTASLGENVALDENDFDSIKTFALEKSVDMVVVGPEVPLVNGIADAFKKESEDPQYHVYRPICSRSPTRRFQELCQRFYDQTSYSYSQIPDL
jgi:phosphoribosylamine--glycine ligase